MFLVLESVFRAAAAASTRDDRAPRLPGLHSIPRPPWLELFALGGESNKGGGGIELSWKSRAHRLEVVCFGTETTELGRTVKWFKLFHDLFAALARCTSR